MLAARGRASRRRSSGAGSSARSRSAAEAFELSDQTAGRVLVTDLALTPADDDESPPGFLADSESGPPPRQAFLAAVRTLNREETVLDVRGDDVAIGVPLYREGGVVGVVVARRRLTEVANAVEEVRDALLAAAGVGLLVAVALAVALASTLLRRLARRAPPRCGSPPRGRPSRCRATPATTRSATSPARSRACRRSCAARSRRGARSWRPRRTSCGRR